MTSPTFLGAFAAPGDLPRGYDRRFVCVGRSNVGKSSFVNAITSSKISRTSATPGRTKTINAFVVGPHTLLLDLPGYGYAKQSREERNVLEGRIFETLTELDGLTRVFVIVDARVGITALDQEMIAFLHTQNLPFTIMANKVDALNQRERVQQERLIRSALTEQDDLVFCSAEQGTGLASVRQVLNEHV